MSLWVLIPLYILYAFTQASVQVKLGHTWAENGPPHPAADLFGFMVIAPLVTAFFGLAVVFYLPIVLFVKYANMLVTDRSS